MLALLITIIIALFIAMVFLNVYFRVKVFKAYKILVQNDVEMGGIHIMNKTRLEKEILPQYPHIKTEIETFVNHIHYSIKMASVLVFLITLFGGVLMWYRE